MSLTTNDHNNNDNNNDDLYSVRLDCGHRHVWPTRKLVTSVIETRYNPGSNSKEDMFVCRDCADEKPGFCMKKSVLHKMAARAHKLSPLEKRAVALQR